MTMKFMERDNHEELLNELLDSELDHTRRAEVLQELRANYTTVVESTEELENAHKKLSETNDDLLLSNSKLFRQVGVVGKPEEVEEEEKQKEFSETVTLEELEGAE